MRDEDWLQKAVFLSLLYAAGYSSGAGDCIVHASDRGLGLSVDSAIALMDK
jgi:hypothetical protein